MFYIAYIEYCHEYDINHEFDIPHVLSFKTEKEAHDFMEEFINRESNDLQYYSSPHLIEIKEMSS